MKNLFFVLLFSCSLTPVFSQPKKMTAEKYPSLLWEITGKGLTKPSYLFGTMHVSNKMVFHLSDSFYLGIRNAQVVALETDPATWQEDFSRYDLSGEGLRYRPFSGMQGYGSSPQDYLSINSLKLAPFDKELELALHSNPSILNSFLYRSNSEAAADFEEDTYLDLHIFQTGRKLGKKVCGVENFHGSMQLVKEAYADAAREKKKGRSYDFDDDFSYARMEEAYRTGNLDLLDTINKVNSQSAAFDEKFLYKRNDIQAASIDSILKTGARLFVGVGAAHLPGERGVIEILRRQGYLLRPIKMKKRDNYHKESIEKIRVPVTFSRQVAEDNFYSVMVPGKLYSFGKEADGMAMKQFADMVNGSYYMVTRVTTNAAIQGQTVGQVQQKLDSVLYENIPGKILLKKAIVKNGYHGYDIVNRTRRGDHQRYNIFITPFEVLIFKMSGTGDYVIAGTEADQFFNSIQLATQKIEWKSWSPSYGGFTVDLPHPPLVFDHENRLYAAYDAATKTAFEVIKTGIHNYDFLEEDAFDLALMEESFSSSEGIDTCLSRQWTNQGGYKALAATYRYKDGAVAQVRFLIQGPHYYTLVATARTPNRWMTQFLQSFAIVPFRYGEPQQVTDTVIRFRVTSPVALEKSGKLSMYPDDMYSHQNNDDDTLINNGRYQSRVVESEKTGEKVHVSFYKQSPYYFKQGDSGDVDSVALKKDWVIRQKKTDSLANGLVVTSYELGNVRSSRLLKGKAFLKDGMGYTLETLADTVAAPGAFIRLFFDSFQPLDSLADLAVKEKKTTLFFAQLFSTDSLQRKRALKNIGQVVMDASDMPDLLTAIGSLSWKEKGYLPMKKELIGKLAAIQSKPASDYLRSVYAQAGDTLELQYAALETLLGQKTAYAYQTFAEIMREDPPVMDISNGSTDYSEVYRPWTGKGEGDADGFQQNGAFFDNLTDSLSLTAGILPSLLPLVMLDDYAKPVMNLLGTLVDSNLLRTATYELYLPKFLLEAKQMLKKQQIREKAKAIEKAAKEDEKGEDLRYRRDDSDNGNGRLSLYATLLLPFWETHPQVPQIITQLLASNDRRLQFTTAMLLLRNNRPLADSVLLSLAATDEYRYELFTTLQKMGKAALFPQQYRTQLSIAQSKLAGWQTYGKPDTLVFLQKMPATYLEDEGVLYIFKYKEKREEAHWKLAAAGLFPRDSSLLYFPGSMEEAEEGDFTVMTPTKLAEDQPEKAQLDKFLKRLLAGRRKSAARFYEESSRYANSDFTRMRY